jgi:hypothetical protein
MLTLADFSSRLCRVVREIPAIFLYYIYSFSRHHWKQGGATHSTNKKTRKGAKQIVIGSGARRRY